MRRERWCGCTAGFYGKSCRCFSGLHERQCPECGMWPWYIPSYDQMMSALKDMNE